MGKQKRYSSEFKLMAVQTYLQGELSANQLAKDLGVHPHSINHWIQDYNNSNNVTTNNEGNGKKTYSSPVTETIIEVNKQSETKTIYIKISALEKEIDDLKTILLTYLIKLS